MTRTIEELRSVDHACAVADSDEHLWEVTAAFVAGGLTRGERVLYFEDGTAAQVLERLADDWVPVRAAIAGGQLASCCPTPAHPLRSPLLAVDEIAVGHRSTTPSRRAGRGSG